MGWIRYRRGEQKTQDDTLFSSIQLSSRLNGQPKYPGLDDRRPLDVLVEARIAFKNMKYHYKTPI